MADKKKDIKSKDKQVKRRKKPKKPESEKSVKQKLRIEVVENMRKDMLNQLESQGKISRYNKDLVEDYLYYYKLKEKMKRHIDKHGLNVTVLNGNGIPIRKVNDNVKEIRETSKMMLKILSDLGVQNNLDSDDPDDDEMY